MSPLTKAPGANEEAGNEPSSKRSSGLLQTSVQTSHAHNKDDALTRLMRRLEAATSRLEDIASSSFDGSTTPASKAGGEAAATNGVPSGTAVGVLTTQDTTATSSAPAAPPKEELPQSVEDFDTLINGDLKAYHELSKAPSIDKLLGEQVNVPDRS